MKFGLRHIRYFVAVAEEVHFRRAAARLGVAQPALSRAIRHLEAEIGVKLFDRSDKQVALTTAGADFLQSSKIILSGVEHAVANVRLVADGKIGTLRIGYTDIAIAGHLPRLLQAFQVIEPRVIVKPHHGVTTEQLDKLEAGLLDIGFVTGPINLQGYDQVPIQSDRFVCIVHDNHRFARARSVRLRDLAEEDFVHGPLHEWEHFYSLLIPLCRQAGFTPRIVQEAFNSAGILGLVASGMGITVLTESTNPALPAGLRQIPIKDVTEQVHTVALWRNDRSTGSCERFTNFLVDRKLSQRV